MKTLDLVRLINDKPYNDLGLNEGMHGIVINADNQDADIMFFNPQNIDDYIIVKIRANDMKLENEKLPKQVQAELQSKLNWLINKSKTSFAQPKFKNYDKVKLINDEKYKAFGLKNGDIGYIMDCSVIKGRILVYFDSTKPDADGFIDTISVKLDDLQLA